MDTLPQPLRFCVLEDLILGEEIGRGAHGRVVAATWEGAPVVVKQIHSLFYDVASDYEYEAIRGTFLRECVRSIQIRHPNIVRFLGIHLIEGAPIPQLVMERLNCNLDTLLNKHPVIPKEIKYNILHGVALGIRFLHTRRPSPIIHRDLSSKNVLVSTAMEGKIGDLGTARFFDVRRQSQMTGVPGTADFMPPEVLTDHPTYSISVDLFSFGCVMLHTLAHEWPTPRAPVVGDQKTRILIALSELDRREAYMKKLINRPGSIPDQVKNLIIQCLSNYPDDRPKIQAVTDQLAEIKSQYSSSLSLTVPDPQMQLQKIKESFRDAYGKMEEVYSYLFPSARTATKTPRKLAQSPLSQANKAPTSHSKLPAVTDEPHSLPALIRERQSLPDTSSSSLPTATKPSLTAVTKFPQKWALDPLKRKKRRLASSSDKPWSRASGKDHMIYSQMASAGLATHENAKEERTEDTTKAKETIATLSEKNTQLPVKNVEETQRLMYMYEEKIKQLETELEDKNLQLTIKSMSLQEENKKLHHKINKQKEERTEDATKDKELIATLSQKNTQLIDENVKLLEENQRLMQEQKEDKIMCENKVKQLETELEDKNIQLTIKSASLQEENKKLMNNIQKQKQILEEAKVELNQQIGQILKLKRKNNQLVTTNAKLIKIMQQSRRHSSKIRLKNILMKTNKSSKQKIQRSRGQSSELKYFIDSDDSVISISSEIIKFGSYYVLHDAYYCGKQCIVKKETIEAKEYSRRLLKQEKKVLEHLKNHPCIVQLLIESIDPKALVLLVENMWMNLTEFITSKGFNHMYNEVTILQNVACGLSYIHKKGIIHCNLTGDSILLTEKGRAKLSDFGKAIFYQQSVIDNLPVTTDILSHMPPEILTPIPSYSTKVDVFSFGCVIIHTITRELPIPHCEKFVAISEDGKYKMHTEIYRRSVVVKKLMNYYNIKFHEIVLRCLQDIPDKRPTAEALYLILNKQKATDVEDVFPEISVSSKLQNTSISLLLEKHLRLLTTLNLSNCKITDQGADMIAKVLLHTTSLEALKISSTSLNVHKIEKINISLKSLVSLKSYEINGSNISDAAADSIAAVILSNAILEKLNLSYNKLSSAGLLQIASALLVSKKVKILDISKNFITSDNIEKVSAVLSECPLQELNLSHNLLMLTGVLKIVQSLRYHDHLRILDLSNNAISFSSACEFIVDVILSVNQELIYLNVSGRNIRPRFIEDYLSPPNIEKNTDRFTLQNLYLLEHASLNTVDIHTKIIKASPETCSNSVVSYYVDHVGGVFYNQYCNFALVIPPGAVCQGECVEILTSANHYNSFEIPDNFYPISSFFWISADYTFQVPVFVIMSHYAKIRSLKDIDHLFVLRSPCQPVTSKNSIMEIVPNRVYFDNKISYCVVATNHFCSFCQAKNDEDIPDYFLSFFYKYYDASKRFHFAEVCFCPSNSECKKVVVKQCKVKGTIPESFSFLFADKEKLWISSIDSTSANGWIIKPNGKSTIHHCDFKYWEIYGTNEAITEAEENCEYPHRFQIKYFKQADVFEPLWYNFAVSKESEEIGQYNVVEVTETNSKSHASTKGTPPQALTRHEDLPMLSVLKKRPLMGELNKIVVERINAEWEDVAYALRYEICVVESIKVRHNNDPKKCCKELLIDWLKTNHGVGEKNWSTLLKSIGEVESLMAANDDILKDLANGKHTPD